MRFTKKVTNFGFSLFLESRFHWDPVACYKENKFYTLFKKIPLNICNRIENIRNYKKGSENYVWYCAFTFINRGNKLFFSFSFSYINVPF